MASPLAPLRPLGGAPLNATSGQTMGMSPDAYADLQRRRSLADALVADAKGSSATSMFGAVAQGIKGFAGASLQQQNAAALAGFAQASPLAAQSLGYGQPDPQVDGFGSLFGRIGSAFGFGSDALDRDRPVPAPNPRAGAGISTTPIIGVSE